MLSIVIPMLSVGIILNFLCFGLFFVLDFRRIFLLATTNGRITQRHKDLEDHSNGTDEFKQLSDRDEDGTLLNLRPTIKSQPDGIATPSLIADIAVDRITNAFRTRAKGSIFVLKPQTWKSRLNECKREREKTEMRYTV